MPSPAVAAGGVPVDAFPRPRRPDLPVAYLHVPRTGGSTVKETFQTTVGESASLIDAHYYRPDPGVIRRLRFVEGHVNANWFARVLGPDWQANTFTVLREPIARVVSQARYLRARRRPGDPDLLRPVRDADALFERIPRLCDHQTKLLAGLDIDTRDVDAATLHRARAVLQSMTFGLTEHFDTTMALVCEHMRLWIARYGFANVSPADTDRDLRGEEFLAAARKHNRFDLELDTFARALFEQRVRRHVEALRSVTTADAPLTHELYVQGHPVEDVVEVPSGLTTIRLAGWALVDGEVADAVLVTIGDAVVPLAARLARPDAARRSRDARHRHAGFLGHVAIPAGVNSIELAFFDRARGRRAAVRVKVHHGPAGRSRPLTRVRQLARAARRGSRQRR
jgi:hypothetical protein